MTHRNRRSRSLALTWLAATTLLTACGPGSPEAGTPNTTPPSATSSATASVPASTGTAMPPATIPGTVPSRPPQAVGSTLAAGEAFIAYYIDLLNYAYTTGDVGPLMAASDKGCEGCKGIADYAKKVNAKNGGLQGDYGDHLVDVKEIYRGEGNRIGGSAALAGGSYTERSSPGASPVSHESAKGTLEFSLSASGGNWIMYEMQITES
ncbi:DUF6318 family protein [Kribbella sp. NPDC048915]|uniref:DUF6318 family protein n=1 Tax=Kribbella sp. NPDC048915 TaxID=3155148 RepID=UPI0033E0A34F